MDTFHEVVKMLAKELVGVQIKVDKHGEFIDFEKDGKAAFIEHRPNDFCYELYISKGVQGEYEEAERYNLAAVICARLKKFFA